MVHSKAALVRAAGRALTLEGIQRSRRGASFARLNGLLSGDHSGHCVGPASIKSYLNDRLDQLIGRNAVVQCPLNVG